MHVKIIHGFQPASANSHNSGKTDKKNYEKRGSVWNWIVNNMYKFHLNRWILFKMPGKYCWGPLYLPHPLCSHQLNCITNPAFPNWRINTFQEAVINYSIILFLWLYIGVVLAKNILLVYRISYRLYEIKKWKHGIAKALVVHSIFAKPFLVFLSFQHCTCRPTLLQY